MLLVLVQVQLLARLSSHLLLFRPAARPLALPGVPRPYLLRTLRRGWMVVLFAVGSFRKSLAQEGRGEERRREERRGRYQSKQPIKTKASSPWLYREITSGPVSWQRTCRSSSHEIKDQYSNSIWTLLQYGLSNCLRAWALPFHPQLSRTGRGRRTPKIKVGASRQDLICVHQAYC